MREKSYSIKLEYKIFGWVLFVFFMFGGIYFLDSSIQENVSEKVGRWCYWCFLMSIILFLGGMFLLWAMLFYFSLKISFVGDEILIKKITKTKIVLKQMIDDVSIFKGGCWIYLKNGNKFFIPSELTDFKEILLILKKHKKTDDSLRPYLGSYQATIGRKKKKR